MCEEGHKPANFDRLTFGSLRLLTSLYVIREDFKGCLGHLMFLSEKVATVYGGRPPQIRHQGQR